MEQLPKLLQAIEEYNTAWNKDRDAAFDLQDPAEHHAEYELVRHHYGTRWGEILSGPVAAAVEEIEEVSFGELADFYPPEECTPDREEAWTASRDEFLSARQGLVTAMERGLVDDAQDALRALSEAEGVWGDDPSTRRIHAILDR